MRTTVFKRIVSAVMAAVVSAGMLSGQELSAFAELADSAQTQIPAVETDLGEHFGEALEDEGFERAAGYTSGDYTYTVSDGKATITKYSGSATNLVIPSTLGGYSVTRIYRAFEKCTSLKSITIPDGVISIGNDAFIGCTSLTRIIIPDSVTSIGNSAFYNCTSLTNITIPDSVTSIGIEAFAWCKSLTSIKIPDGVTSIENSAFWGCKNLTSIIIPDSVNSIGDSAFSSCKSLISITIPDSLTSIGVSAFYNCASLTRITIPDSVTSIGEFAFVGCVKLSNINVSLSNSSYCDMDGILFSKDKTQIITFPGGRAGSYAIPDGVTSIGSSAFSKCTSLSSITISDSVISIGDSAFSSCENLTNISIPDSVTTIGDCAFQACTSLKSITIPDGVTSISNSSFRECNSLISIEIPDGITSIECWAFDGCTNLKNITIPSSVTLIDGGAFNGCASLTSITIPESVTILRSGFKDCTSLTSITLPSCINSLGSEYFKGCKSLTSITLPDTITCIGMYAFSDCTSLTSITIPDSVNTIQGGAFEGCTNLKSITIPDGVASIQHRSFKGCTSLTSITIPDSVDTIEYYSFQDCTSLKSITIPDSVTSIELDAFKSCTALTDVYYKGTLSQWKQISIGTGNGCLTDNLKTGYGNNQCPIVTTDNPGTITIKNEAGDPVTITTTDNKDYKLVQAQYSCGTETKNILTNYCKIDPKSVPYDINFAFQAEKTDDVESYILMCGNRQVARSTTGAFTLKSNELPCGSTYYVTALMKNGSATKTPIMLEVEETHDYATTNTLQLGSDGAAIKVDKDIPYIGGSEIGCDKIDLPVEIVVCDGMAYVGVNITDTYDIVSNEKKRKEFEKQFSDIKNAMKNDAKTLTKDLKKLRKEIKGKSLDVGANSISKSDFDVIGYGKCEWDRNGMKSVEFELVFVFKAEVERSFQTVVWVIPVTVTFGAEFEAKLGASVKYDLTTSTFSGELRLDVMAALTAFGGVGVSKVAAIGATGKAQLDIGIILLSSVTSSGIDKATLYGGLGLKAYIGPLKYEKYYLESTWKIYSRSNGTAVQELNNTGYSAGDFYCEDNYSLSGTVYASDFVSIVSDGVLISNVYLGAAPQIASNDSDTVMTFLSSNLERGAANQVQLMYSVYSSEDGSWSEPEPVDSNETGDWTHKLRVVDGDIWLLYQDSDTVLADDADIDTLAYSLTVAAMKFDPETGAFIDPVCVSGTNGYNFLPAIGTANSAPVAAWVNNTDTDFFGLNSTNAVRYSTYSDGAWSEGVEIASGLNCVTDLAAGELDGKLCIAYITDGDNDLTTADDRALYLYSDGNTALISEGAVSALYMGALPDGKNALCWIEDGALNYIKAADGTKKALFNTTISGKYVVTDDATFFGNETHIYAAKYEYGSWTKPVEVYNAEGTVTAFAADNERLLAVDTVMTENGDDIADSSDLHCISYRETENVTLEYVDFEYEKIGSTVPLEVCVTNNGMDTLTAVNVLITDDSANEVYSGTTSCNIVSGDSEELTVTMPIETLDDRTYTISVTTENDSNPNDNSAEFTLGKTEIDLSVCTIVDGGKAYLEVTAENESAVAAGTVISILDEDGNTISQKDIGTLSAKSKATERFGLDDILGENDSRSVTVQLTVDKEEYYTHNNTLRQYIKAIDTDIPYKYVTFLNTDGTLLSGTIYDADTLITAPELPEGCTGWYAVGDETKTLIGDFSGINVDIAFVAKGPDIPCSVKAHSLLLGDDIGVKYYIEFSDDVLSDSTSVIKFTVNGRETTAAVSEAAKTDNRYEFTCHVAPAEMNDTITGQLFVGGQATGDSFTYSVKTYADYILANSEEYTDEVPLVEAMLNYGAAAEKYFRGSTEISFTKPEITAEELAAYKYVVTDNDKDYNFVGQVITLNSKITAKLYFSGKDFSVSDFTVKQNGISVDASRLCVNTDDKGTYLAISGISANEMGESFTIMLGGVTVSNYSVFSYVQGAINSSLDGLPDVVSALYAYGRAAESYSKLKSM